MGPWVEWGEGKQPCQPLLKAGSWLGWSFEQWGKHSWATSQCSTLTPLEHCCRSFSWLWPQRAVSQLWVFSCVDDTTYITVPQWCFTTMCLHKTYLAFFFTKSASYHGLSNIYSVSSFLLPLGYFLWLNQMGKFRGMGKGTGYPFLLASPGEQQVTSHGCLCTCSSPVFRAEMLQRLWSVTQVCQVCHLSGIQANAEDDFWLRIRL